VVATAAVTASHAGLAHIATATAAIVDDANPHLIAVRGRSESPDRDHIAVVGGIPPRPRLQEDAQLQGKLLNVWVRLVDPVDDRDSLDDPITQPRLLLLLLLLL